MASPGHKSNILNKSFNQDGLAIAVGSPTGAADAAGTWVQEFGKKG
jgi:uncharacterized protein YkwD